MAVWPSARSIAVLPSKADFPYSIRVVSEITESNGSSSMASVCGGCLSLMDAGVPLKAHVAGIAMGLIKDANRFAVLTDILGDEDHLGDMDFKVAGTGTGVTALQMDIKIQGITKEIMQVALAQAKEARLHILAKMQEAVGGAKAEVSQFAPRLYTMKINPEKIRDVIGKGGSTIRALTEETGCTIDIAEDGTITIASTDADRAAFAKKRIEEITAEVEVGKIYEGAITKILDFGALVNLLPGKDGLLHISQIAHQRIEKVTDVLSEGQIVKVKVLETDDKGRVKLSMKALLERPEGMEDDRGDRPPRRDRGDRAQITTMPRVCVLPLNAALTYATSPQPTSAPKWPWLLTLPMDGRYRPWPSSQSCSDHVRSRTRDRGRSSSACAASDDEPSPEPRYIGYTSSLGARKARVDSDHGRLARTVTAHERDDEPTAGTATTLQNRAGHELARYSPHRPRRFAYHPPREGGRTPRTRLAREAAQDDPAQPVELSCPRALVEATRRLPGARPARGAVR